MDMEKIKKLQQMVDESQRIVFFGGAGVRLSAGTDSKPYLFYEKPAGVLPVLL